MHVNVTIMWYVEEDIWRCTLCIKNNSIAWRIIQFKTKRILLIVWKLAVNPHYVINFMKWNFCSYYISEVRSMILWMIIDVNLIVHLYCWRQFLFIFLVASVILGKVEVDSCLYFITILYNFSNVHQNKNIHNAKSFEIL